MTFAYFALCILALFTSAAELTAAEIRLDFSGTIARVSRPTVTPLFAVGLPVSGQVVYATDTPALPSNEATRRALFHRPGAVLAADFRVDREPTGADAQRPTAHAPTVWSFEWGADPREIVLRPDAGADAETFVVVSMTQRQYTLLAGQVADAMPAGHSTPDTVAVPVPPAALALLATLLAWFGWPRREHREISV